MLEYLEGMQANDDHSHKASQDVAQARWLCFREAAKDLVAPEQWSVLEAAWSATERVKERPFRIGDCVRISRITCTNNGVEQLSIGTTGVVTAFSTDGCSAELARMCWKIQTSDGGRWATGWHADDELELVP